MKPSLVRKATGFTTAVLHQGGPVPAVGGVVKPFKPGGYTDSSADLAYNLQQAGERIVTPSQSPSPSEDKDWSFPDTEEGVRLAIKRGANVLWANTTLHASHSIVTLREELERGKIRMIGQNPLDTEKYEDKYWLNKWLATHSELRGFFPKSSIWKKGDDRGSLWGFGVPAVVKPIRGRGSHGVQVVKTLEDLETAIDGLLEESEAVMLESYCPGEEVTVTVMPPGSYTIGERQSHWSLPVVTRFNHIDGIAPYNGVVAVVKNSRVLSEAEHGQDKHYLTLQAMCEKVADLCNATAPIRVDARREKDGGPFILFDVNMKPNATGPGRPGREDQASLTTMAAEGIGWSYADLIVNILRQAKLISDILR